MNESSCIGNRALGPKARRLATVAETCGETCEVEVIHAAAVQQARAALPSATQAARLVELFGGFANVTRLRILAALRSAVGAVQPELCVCDLVAITGASQSMVSHQLAALRVLGLATNRRQGRLIYYRLAEGPLARLVEDALACVSPEAP